MKKLWSPKNTLRKFYFKTKALVEHGEMFSIIFPYFTTGEVKYFWGRVETGS